jgi:hypothetical protein
MKMRPIGGELLYADGWTDRIDEANNRFSKFCETRLKIMKKGNNERTNIHWIKKQ